MGRPKREGEFICSHCKRWSPPSRAAGTKHRNHCPFCLWSRHVDLKEAGDRRSACKAGMEPVGLTFKQKGTDKWGKPRQGEIMIIHQCTLCGKISINMVAGDDTSYAILNTFKKSKSLSQKMLEKLKKNNIQLLTENDKSKILVQLFGKNYKAGQVQ